MLHAIYKLLDLLHESQLERGLASLYLQNHGDFSEELERQFVKVDGLLNVVNALPLGKSANFAPFYASSKYLITKRKYIVSRQISPEDVILYYTKDIIAPAIEIVKDLAILDSSNSPPRVSSFINFLLWKERVGIERAIGAQYIANINENDSAIKSRLAYIIEEQQAYERMFLSLADDHCRKEIETLEQNNEIFQKIQLINDSFAKGNLAKIADDIKPNSWFEMFSAKMDLLHEVSKSIASKLCNSNNNQTLEKAIDTKKLNSTDYILSNGLNEYIKYIKTLPLFIGIDNDVLFNLLKHARIAKHSKGNLIFMQGEQASRFYIVLNGWVKLFKGNIEGQESILQVIHKGEALIESVLITGSIYPVSAQAVESCVLLSIPTAIIKEQMQNNQYLAINMLATLAGRSQDLISQFEQLTLKTVTQRVGWFLLKLYLDNGEKSLSLKLPYDKSLIAGYLGMKPETFSRTLQTLREQGISSEQNLINLRNALKLCEYCDVELTARCSRSGTNICRNISRLI